MKLTRYGQPIANIFLASLVLDVIVVVAIGVLFGVLAGVVAAVATLPISIFAVSFFRDPVRRADIETLDDNVLYAPADGTVTDIVEIDDQRLGGKALRVGIFLSVFSVHINRVPCRCKVVSVELKDGVYHDARDPRASEHNCAADMLLESQGAPASHLPAKLVVRQITGLIARRIVCNVKPGDTFDSGQQYGMIRFGSRTELIIPADTRAEVLVGVGQKVKAGNDELIRCN